MKTKVNNQHDYISLRLTEAKDRTLNLTWSYSRDTCSGKIDVETMKRAMKPFGAIREKTGGTLGEKMELLKVLAEAAPTIDNFIAAMEGMAFRAAAPQIR